MSFWTLDNEQTAGYLRHAEIKHGRVAMAAFLGDCVQCLGVVKGKHTFLPYCGYVADVSPQEQWGYIPVIGKLQILTFVGMLGSFGEVQGDVPHYTAPGGLPGDDQIKVNRPETHSPRRAVRHLRRADGPEEVALPLSRGQQRPAAQLASRLAHAHSATSDCL